MQRSQETGVRRQNEQPGENIQYPVPQSGIPQGGRISNVQVNSPKTGSQETGDRIKQKTSRQ